ncbi:hypothetical protein Hdeb2414_s0020g00558071 [Helianthus debilis subsp. tardiflorus]
MLSAVYGPSMTATNGGCQCSVSLILGVSWLAFVSLLHVSFKPAMVVAFFSMDIDVLGYDDVV